VTRRGKPASPQFKEVLLTPRMETYKSLSIPKLFVVLSSGLPSVCNFGHGGETIAVISL